MPYLKISEKYKNHKIIFLAKPGRIDFLKKFDKKHVDIIIPFSPNDFSANINYQNKIIKKLSTYNITDIINIGCAYSPVDKEPESTIKLCKLINAQNKIAHVIEPVNNELKQNYNFYTEVIYTPNKDLFEFERNKLFFEKLLNIKIKESTLPYINIPKREKKCYVGIAPFKRNGYVSFYCLKTKNYHNAINTIFQNT